MQDLKIILNLFDGDSAGAAQGTESNSEAAGEGEKAVSRQAAQRGRELGISDDLLSDYENAFFKGGAQPDEGQTQQTEEQETEDNTDAEFEKLITGKYKDAYKKKTESFIKERVKKANKDNAELRSQLDKTSRISQLLSDKYGEQDADKLYESLRNDQDFWRQKALDSGRTVDEMMNDYDATQAAQAQQQELETLRREKAAAQLNTRLEALAKETQKEYPDFDLHAELENKRFRQALDYIAAQNDEANKANGTDNEIFDLTYAYELAHSDEIKANTIKRVSKATASAVAQTLQANRNRPKENAGTHTSQAKAKSYGEMSDEEFAAYLEKVRRKEARI